MIKKLSAILLVFSLLASFAACRKLEDSEFTVEENAFVVDDEGVTQELQTRVNEDGKTEYYYTDADGNTVVVDKNKVEIETTLIPVQTTLSDKDIEDLINNPEKIEDLITEEITEPEFEMSDGIISTDEFKEVEVEIGSDGKPVRVNATQTYEEIVKSGKFTVDLTIKSNVDGDELTMPVKMMRDGNKMFLETTIPVSDISKMRVNMLMNDDGYFIIIPIMNAYYKVPTDEISDLDGMLADFDFSNIESDLEMSDAYVSSGKVTVNGKTYDCDIYKGENETTTKYYYLNNELKRIESTTDKDSYIVEFKEISGTVNSNKFKTPTGRDLATLAGTLEGISLPS